MHHDFFEQPEENGRRLWRNDHGDIVVRTVTDMSWPVTPLQAVFRIMVRENVKKRGAGLIEAVRREGERRAWWIDKKRHGTGYVFFGMLFLPENGGTVTWNAILSECGTTGVREAVVTQRLMKAKKLTAKNYEKTFGRDPYDDALQHEDPSLRRFLSDDEEWDEDFPDHPLTRMRRLMRELPECLIPAPS